MAANERSREEVKGPVFRRVFRSLFLERNFVIFLFFSFPSHLQIQILFFFISSLYPLHSLSFSSFPTLLSTHPLILSPLSSLSLSLSLRCIFERHSSALYSLTSLICGVIFILSSSALPWFSLSPSIYLSIYLNLSIYSSFSLSCILLSVKLSTMIII